MKLRILMLLVLACSLLGAQESRKQYKPKPGKKSAATQLTIPAGAQEIGPGTYRFTDAQGKTWIYRKTPFSVVRYEDKQETAPAAAPDSDLKAVGEGENVRFERHTPFGVKTWVRKKTELNDAEQAAWDRAQQKQAAALATKK